MDKDAILKALYDAVIEGDPESATQAAEQSLEAGIAPADALDQGLTLGIREVGDRFGRMEMFLPEMVLSAKAMEAAVTVLEPHFEVGTSSKKAKVMIGTVAGDIHDIGKNITIALLKVSGYEVVDLGRDVASVDFVDKAIDEGAELIGMSGLLTTSLPMMRDVIEMLNEDGVRDKVKVIIGGGPTSKEYAAEIGADGYGETAYDAVSLCETLLA
jgi:corrinoid protein of di/trimethylamine methyltransferase